MCAQLPWFILEEIKPFIRLWKKQYAQVLFSFVWKPGQMKCKFSQLLNYTAGILETSDNVTLEPNTPYKAMVRQDNTEPNPWLFPWKNMIPTRVDSPV